MDQVEIVEVGPRDGLQNIPVFVPTETKIALIRALAAAGFRRMEIGSFVGPKAVPQMRDMEAVAAAVGIPPGVRAMVLVPNARGFQRAIAAGYNEIELVVSVSDAHNRANVGRPTQESVEDLRRLLAEQDPEGRLFIRIGLATSFHCPFAGLTEEAEVLALLASGELDLPITVVDGLQGAAGAQQALADGAGPGKQVVRVDRP